MLGGAGLMDTLFASCLGLLPHPSPLTSVVLMASPRWAHASLQHWGLLHPGQVWGWVRNTYTLPMRHSGPSPPQGCLQPLYPHDSSL